MSIRIAVIGAGVVGLSSAINVQRSIPNARVTVIADKIGPDTLSYWVGGLFRPDLSHIVKGDNGEVMKQCLRDSWKHFSNLAMSDKARDSGHILIPTMLGHSRPMDADYALLKECAFDFHQIPASELRRRGFPYQIAYSCTTIMSQPNVYMHWLMKEFLSGGGELQKRTVNKIEELHGDFQVVINCSGLRAKTLVDDKEMYPVRGQLVMLRAPWIKHCYYLDTDIYVFPHMEKVVIGGTRTAGDWNTDVDPEIERTLLRNAEAIFPELKGAERIGGWTGLRPGRPCVRLEIETLDLGHNRKLPVVHNYGHAGHGVTLSWGTGVHAAKLAKQALSSLPKSLL